MALSIGKRKAVRCSYCIRDVTVQFRVHCAVCPDFQLCHDCFTAGVTLNPHDPSHDYKVADCLDIPIFVKDWTVNDELTLLDGIERHGVGNWKTISDLLLPHKSTKQIEEHYWELYMGVHGYCLPSKVLLSETPVETCSLIDGSSSSSNIAMDIDGPPEGASANDAAEEVIPESALNRVRVTKGYSLGEVVRRDIGKESVPKGRASSNTLSGASAGGDKNDKDKPVLPGSDLPGYIPLREDFDVEFENDAELLLADMEFTPEDHPSELELKLQVIRIYNNKLNERDKRKRFVIERGLVDCKQQQAVDRKRSKEERELVAKMRVFARFQTPAEHEALVDGILKARKLRQQIELYKHYRQMGIRTLDQARQYEQDRKVKDRDMKAKKHREGASYVFENGRNVGASWTESSNGAGASAASGAGGGVGGGRRGNSSSEEVSGGGGGLTASGSYSQLSEGSKSGAAAAAGAAGRRKSGRVTIEDTPAVQAPIEEDSLRGKRTSRHSEGNLAAASGAATAAATGSKRAKLVVDVDGDIVTEQQLQEVSNAPGGDLLGEAEVELCARVPLMPLHYLAAKDALVREAYAKGLLTHDGIKRILKLEPKKTSVIYDFFVKELLVNEPTVSYPPVVTSSSD